tara:strand:+ start:264 stop:974 length:711 start_codon:yes stop_codon:yes gene_type:complete
MNKKLIYFSKNQKISTMSLKIFILIFFLFTKIGYANVIYDKNGIIITDIEMNNYKELYKNNLGRDISNNKLIKNIVLIKKTINYLIKNNPDFISVLDQKIKLEYSKEIFDNQSLLNFIRFQNIKNEFISEYFQNFFSINDLEIIFANFDSLKLPISKNDCLTVEKLYEFSNNKNFIEGFFKNLRNKSQKITISINNELYDVCLNNKSLKYIESEIIKFIENKIGNDFDKFIYSKDN